MAELRASRTVISWGLPSVLALRLAEGMKAVRAAGLVVSLDELELATGAFCWRSLEGILRAAEVERPRRAEERATVEKALRATDMVKRAGGRKSGKGEERGGMER